MSCGVAGAARSRPCRTWLISSGSPREPTPPRGYLERMSVLYVLACGSPAARRLPVLVELAQAQGWQVVVATSDHGRRFVDPDELAKRTGHPVCSTFEEVAEHPLPPAQAIVMAPATV